MFDLLEKHKPIAERHARIERPRLAYGAGDGGDSSAMERPDVSPVETRIESGIDLRRCSES